MSQPGHLSLLRLSDLACWPQMAEGNEDPWGLQTPPQKLAAASKSSQARGLPNQGKCDTPRSELRGPAQSKSHQEPKALALSQVEQCKQNPFTFPRVSDKS